MNLCDRRGVTAGCAGAACLFEHVTTSGRPHKSFVIARVAPGEGAAPRVIGSAHASWGGGNRKRDLGDYINPRRSAKYSGNFTPEWIKTCPFIFLLVTGKKKKPGGLNPTLVYETYVPHHSREPFAAGRGKTFISLQLSIPLFFFSNCSLSKTSRLPFSQIGGITWPPFFPMTNSNRPLISTTAGMWGISRSVPGSFLCWQN